MKKYDPRKEMTLEIRHREGKQEETKRNSTKAISKTI